MVLGCGLRKKISDEHLINFRRFNVKWANGVGVSTGEICTMVGTGGGGCSDNDREWRRLMKLQRRYDEEEVEQ